MVWPKPAHLPIFTQQKTSGGSIDVPMEFPPFLPGEGGSFDAPLSRALYLEAAAGEIQGVFHEISPCWFMIRWGNSRTLHIWLVVWLPFLFSHYIGLLIISID